MSEGNGRSWSAEIKELGDKIATLTKPQAAELSEYLEQGYKIKGASGGPATAVAEPTAVATAAPVAEPTDFAVILEGLADEKQKLNVIKVVRELVPGLGLKEAKALVESPPKPVKESAPKDEAQTIKKKLEEAGAKISLKPV